MNKVIKTILREGLILESRIKTDMSVPEDVLAISDIFKKNGYKLYIVGGAVRDFLLNKEIKDYDLATDANPDTVEAMMQKAGFRTLATGKAFGVINVFTANDEFEIATFRTDKYIDGEVNLESFKTYLKSLNNGKYEKFLNYLMK